MPSGECIANIDAVSAALESLKAIYAGESAAPEFLAEPFISPDAALDAMFSTDVVFSIAKTIAMQNGLEAMIASNRPLFLFEQSRASYYAGAAIAIDQEITAQEDFKWVTSKYLGFGEAAGGEA